MSKLQTVEIKLPFAGFYNSLYSDLIDHEESQYAEYHSEDGDESEWPEELKLDSSFYAGALFDVTSYDAAYFKIAQDYLDAFSRLAGEAMGISAPESIRFYSWAEGRYKRERRQVKSLRLQWAAMESPGQKPSAAMGRDGVAPRI